MLGQGALRASWDIGTRACVWASCLYAFVCVCVCVCMCVCVCGRVCMHMSVRSHGGRSRSTSTVNDAASEWRAHASAAWGRDECVRWVDDCVMGGQQARGLSMCTCGEWWVVQALRRSFGKHVSVCGCALRRVAVCVPAVDACVRMLIELFPCIAHVAWCLCVCEWHCKLTSWSCVQCLWPCGHCILGHVH